MVVIVAKGTTCSSVAMTSQMHQNSFAFLTSFSLYDFCSRFFNLRNVGEPYSSSTGRYCCPILIIGQNHNVSTNFSATHQHKTARDISVGIATGFGLDGPGIESRWGGEIFRTRPDRPWGPPSLLYNGYRVFPGGKAARALR